MSHSGKIAFDRDGGADTLAPAARPIAIPMAKKQEETGPGLVTGLRMRDLTRETGLPRETIHFYIAQGLIPHGTKTGRNTAEYGSEHLERLHRIRDLQARHFLPLRAIKALLEDELAAENLTAEQQALLERVRATMPQLGRVAPRQLPLAEAAGRLSKAELEELTEAGIVEIHGRGAAATVSSEDAEILRAWSDARDAGLTPELGFHPGDLAIYDTAIRRLVREELRKFSRAFADRPTGEATEAIAKALPLIERLLAVLHDKHVRREIAEGAASGKD